MVNLVKRTNNKKKNSCHMSLVKVDIFLVNVHTLIKLNLLKSSDFL
jgi:hypothetical protein